MQGGQQIHHGAAAYVPELLEQGTNVTAQQDKAGRMDGRFGRLFGIGEKYRGSEPLQPHPSPQYDLRLLGDIAGPMNEGESVAGDGLAPAGMTFFGQFIRS